MSPLSPNANRISDLPGNVIDHILSRLPLRDGVRTSLLSREWRYKWTSIPDLVFDFRFDKSVLRNYQVENIIYQVLLHHQGSVNKFALQVPTYKTSPDVDQWIQFLLNHRVQDFTLHFYCGLKYLIPSRFFAFQHLRHLNLYRCVFELPLGFKGFSQLVSLDCQEVDYTPAMFRQFFSQCSQLEKVRLVGCTDWDSIEVEGPKLRFFTFHGVFRSIRFKNCSLLAEVSLSTPIFDNRATRSSTYLKKYFDFVPTLEKLHLHPGLLEFLGAGGAPNRFPSSLNRLRFLNLSLYLDSIEEVSFALCLIRSSPDLHKLRITFYASRNVEAVVEFLRVQQTPDCHIKKVEIAIFSGTESQVEFVTYLLAAAGALAEMVISISPCLSVSHDGGLGLMNQLRQLPRASPNAQIHVRK